MFCKVTLMGDARSQNTQLMRAVKAIATAAAGSTPSVTGSTVYNNASTGQYEVITSVLDNTVAGGWTLKADQTTLSGAVVSTNTFLETLMLYNTTGKSGLPYIWFSMIEGAYTTSNLSWGPFVSFGYATTLANCNYGSGHNVTTNWTTTNSNTVYSGCIVNTSTNTQNYDYMKPFGIFNTTTRVYYISVTAEYIHVQQDVTTATNSGAWFHLGLRTNSSWEDNYNDNPYWTAVWDAQGSSYGYQDGAGVWTVMRPIDTSSGAVGTPVNIFRYSGQQTNTVNMNPVTGQSYNTSYAGDYYKLYAPPVASSMYVNYPTNYTTSYSSPSTTYTQAQNSGMSTYGVQANIFTPVTLFPTSSLGPSVGLTSDSTTNALISPALPMYIRYQGNSNFGGYLKNLFQGAIFATSAELDLYHVVDASYTIDGSTYIGIRIGSGNTGASSARQLVYVKAS